jgi:bifunctional UDP-N-acetylglucosamine pyrophosphorylase/glucosamine-1-phosphate N-acetyltransferase
MLQWVLDAARAGGCGRCLVVVGHGSDDVRDAFGGEDVTWIEQTEQLGTGHALAQVREHVSAGDRLLVLSGDVPGIRAETIAKLLTAASESWGSIAVAEMENPGALGRVVRRDNGSLASIIEAVDASPGELAITTINAGIYVLPAPEVFEYLEALRPDNRKGELYLTDALAAAAARHRVETVLLDDPSEALGVNDRRDLARVHRELVGRAMSKLVEMGVTIYDPSRTVVEATVEVGRDSEIHPGVSLLGATSVGEGSVIGTGAWIRDCEIGERVEVHPYSVLDGAAVGDETSIGPFARLRPGTRIGQRARVGNFVEVKNSLLGDGVKAGHLTYLGDAEVGGDANIGAGTITCNYDGLEKHPTTIGRRAFIGSDTMLVAPVTVGDDATTGAGSVITTDVPDGALGVERGKQRNVEGWSQRRRPKDE